MAVDAFGNWVPDDATAQASQTWANNLSKALGTQNVVNAPPPPVTANPNLGAGAGIQGLPAIPPTDNPVSLPTRNLSLNAPAANVDLSGMNPTIPRVKIDLSGRPVPTALQGPDANVDLSQAGKNLQPFGPMTPTDATAGTPKYPYMPAPGGKVVKVGATTTPLVDPDVQKRLLAGYGEEQAGIGEEAKAMDQESAAEQTQSEAKQTGYLVKEAAQNQAMNDTKERADQRVKDAEAWQDKLTKMADQVAKQGNEIGPDQFWAKQSTFKKIGFGIASILGGALMGLQRRATNPAFDQIQQMVEDDVKAQQMRYEASKGKLGEMNSLYGQAMKVADNKEEAYRLATSYGLDQAATEADRMAEASNSDIYKARADIVKSQLKQKSAAIGILQTGKEAETEKYTPAHYAATGGASEAQIQKTAGEIRKLGIDSGKDPGEDEARRQAIHRLTGRDPLQGAPELNLSKPAKAQPLPPYVVKLNEEETDLNNIDANINRMKALMAKGASEWSPTDRAEANSLQTTLSQQVALQLHRRSPTASVIHDVSDVVPNVATDWSGKSAKIKQLDNLMGDWRRGLDQSRKAYGSQPISSGGSTPTGFSQ